VTETLIEFFKAMAHESRLRIVGLLAGAERSVQELAALLDLKEPTVSHHLAILKAQGLVTVRAEGVTRWHALDVEALERLTRSVLEQHGGTRPPAAPTWDAKVLQGFVGDDGQLKVIPASRRKRGVVLRWLMQGFTEGKRYAESEVNDIIQDKHWDCATLRRELIGHKMLARAGGVYWRLPEAEWKEGGEA
jgi:DNA-binding transcriptional ArsR family regulator